MPTKVDTYIQILTIAASLGEGLVTAIKNHAASDLTPEEYQALEQSWNSDVIRSAVDAGIPPEPDTPLS